MKQTGNYKHINPVHTQVPDTKAGAYYVSAIDGPHHYLLLGPFAIHAHAIQAVGEVQDFASEHPKGFWMSYGTVRYPEGHAKEGSANKYLPHLLNQPTA